MEDGQVHLLDCIEDEPGQVVLLELFGQRRRHQERLIALNSEEVVAHASPPDPLTHEGFSPGRDQRAPQARRKFVQHALDTPGIEVRPLRQPHGDVGFSEVFFTDVEALVGLARRRGLDQDADVRMAVADLYVQAQVFRRHMRRVVTRQARGEDEGFAASLTKLFWSEMETRIFETALDILGPFAELNQEAPASKFPGRLDRRYWHARALALIRGG